MTDRGTVRWPAATRGDGGLQPFGRRRACPRSTPQESDCVTAAIPLPWTKPSSPVDPPGRRRQRGRHRGHEPAADDAGRAHLHARRDRRSAGYQFAADAQFLPYRDGRFLLVARGVTGDFVATALAPDLVAGTRLYSAAASATERMLGAIALPTTTIAITDEHFVNVGSGHAVTWSAALGAADGSRLPDAAVSTAWRRRRTGC